MAKYCIIKTGSVVELSDEEAARLGHRAVPVAHQPEPEPPTEAVVVSTPPEAAALVEPSVEEVGQAPEQPVKSNAELGEEMENLLAHATVAQVKNHLLGMTSIAEVKLLDKVEAKGKGRVGVHVAVADRLAALREGA